MRLPADHRDHLPGDLDDRPAVLGAGAADLGGDGPDLHDLLVLFVVPVGLEWYLRGIASVTEEQLAALTVTSPFSAAASVPMHTTRNEIWSDKPLAVADPVLVRLAGRLRPAGVGDFPLHLSAALPGILLRHLSRVSLALVAGRGPRVAVQGQGAPGYSPRSQSGPKPGKDATD